MCLYFKGNETHNPEDLLGQKARAYLTSKSCVYIAKG